jgi:prepilin-type N-terminal cleavage/methylation domain-containing protein
MSRPFSKSPELRHPRGFTLVELLVAMALSLTLLGMAFNLFNQLNDTADVAGTMADVNSNLLAGVNLVGQWCYRCYSHRYARAGGAHF